jgi:hypothetical protein
MCIPILAMIESQADAKLLHTPRDFSVSVIGQEDEVMYENVYIYPNPRLSIQRVTNL